MPRAVPYSARDRGKAGVDESYRRLAFSNGHLRLREARKLRIEFQRTWAQYAATSPFSIRLVGDERDRLRYTLTAQLTESPPLTSGMIFSGWLHHLRTSLDNAMYTLAAQSSGKRKPPNHTGIYYPILTTPESFKGRDYRQYRLTDRAIDALEARQPYMNPAGYKCSYLYWLNHLSNIDKHRAPHLCVGRISMSQIRRLQFGVDFEQEAALNPGEILKTPTPLQIIRTDRALRSLEVDFVGRPVVLPEVKEWAEAGEWTEADDLGRVFKVGHPLLLDRMEHLEMEVLSAFAEIVKLSGHNPGPYVRDLVRHDLPAKTISKLDLDPEAWKGASVAKAAAA